jgi:hypothetical protein
VRLLAALAFLVPAAAAAACVPTGGPPGACAKLSACCSQAGAASETSCDDTIEAAIDSVCESELVNLEESGACFGDASTGSCSVLLACCPGMPAGDVVECQRTAMLNVASTCSAALGNAEVTGACNGGTGTDSGTGRDGGSGGVDGGHREAGGSTRDGASPG